MRYWQFLGWWLLSYLVWEVSYWQFLGWWLLWYLVWEVGNFTSVVIVKMFQHPK
jgi:hypothetical protein